jgi:hypothetical protein
VPWTKSGDNAATYPRLLAVDELHDAEDWSVNEVAGFILRLFFHSAGHMTDYVVRFGDVRAYGGGRHEILVEQATDAGLMELVSGEGRGRVWKLIEDPEFVHLRKRSEVMWERQRDRDRRNPDLTMPVRLRDGDACRYCEQVVAWADRKSGRGGTYDHRDPGEAATVETYVVSCRSCNSKRKNDEHADQNTPLLPVPAIPHYTTATRRMLEAFFGPERVTARLGEAPPSDTARPQPITARDVRPAAAAPEPQQAPHAPEAERPAVEAPEPPTGPPGPPSARPPRSSPDHRPITDRSQISGVDAGSGRVGSGRVRSGQDRSGQVGSQPRRRPRRRGKRNPEPDPPQRTPREGP